MLHISDFFIGRRFNITSSTFASLKPGAGTLTSSSTALLTSLAILITHEYISKRKITCTKVVYGKNMNTLLYEMTLKNWMMVKKIDEKEPQELQKIHNHPLDNRKEKMKNTHLKVEDIVGDVLKIDSISTEKTAELKNF